MHYLTDADAIIAAIAHYSQAKILWLDIEVADYLTDERRLSLIQVLDDPTDLKGDRVSILDVLDRPELSEFFIEKIMANSPIEKVFHNAKYDCGFLGKNKAKNITCTLEIARKIPYYLLPMPNFKLKTLAEKLCHFPPINKTEQAGDWGKRPLSGEQLYYAKMDPVYLAGIHHRLLQLTRLFEADPATEDINALTLRYRQIEHQWKQLDTEMQHLKERLKRAMESQNVSKLSGFQLSSYNRTTKKVPLTDLTQLIQAEGIELGCPITLTKELQKELGELIKKLPVEEETHKILQLKVTEIEDEDLPF